MKVRSVRTLRLLRAESPASGSICSIAKDHMNSPKKEVASMPKDALENGLPSNLFKSPDTQNEWLH